MVAKRNPAEPPASNFDRHYSLEELAARQGAVVVDEQKWQEMKTLAEELWPNQQTIEEFQSFLQDTRGLGTH